MRLHFMIWCWLVLCVACKPEIDTFSGKNDTTNPGDTEAQGDLDPADQPGDETSSNLDEGWIAFIDDNPRILYLMESRVGAEPIVVNDQLEGSGDDVSISISPDGGYLLIDSERSAAECGDWHCLGIVPRDFSGPLEAVRTGVLQEVVHSDGAILGYDALSIAWVDVGEGAHVRDIYVAHGTPPLYGAPLNATAGSSFAHNSEPTIDHAHQSIAFVCTDEPFGEGSPHNICRVDIDGSNFRVVVDATVPPAGLEPGMIMAQPSFAPDGSLVFEGDWSGHRIWRWRAPSELTLLAPQFTGDTTPCVLADGRIVSAWSGRSGSQGPELKIMNADGSGELELLPGHVIFEVGLSCGGP